MRLNLLTLTLLLFTCTSLFAQPPNDECAGLIDLGVIPYCPDLEFFTNVDATETNIGSGNFPTGCNGGDITFVGRDVFFQFSTDNVITDYTITVTGITDGMGSDPLMNPQIMIYRGDCLFDELSLLGCAKAADGDNEIAIDILGLDLNTPYFIRISDWSASATPNAGTFKLCVNELDPVYIMGEDIASGACNGTLYDSGGPDNDYENNENFTFTVCPDQFFSCLAIDLVNFQTEPEFDDLIIYAGDNTGAPVLANLSGGIGNAYSIEATSSCVTFVFDSDGSAVQAGFELTWACNAAACPGSSVENPTVLTGPLPIDLNGETTCSDASNFSQTPCGNSAFINGPEYVYEYQAPGGFCVTIQVTNAEPGTGVLVLNGPPDDPATICVATNANGSIASANMETAGTYYIVVANADGCTDFDLSITETECSFLPSLEDALGNPLNACDINSDGTPNQFSFEDGFQDLPNTVGVNNGCWFGVGIQPDYVWFTVEIQQDGAFGFILSSAGTPSDIDFNVWGPFTSEEVTDTPQDVIDFITNNQPIRSSYAGQALPTGLTDIHPDDGYPITDEYDCNGLGMENNDQFVRTVDGIAGEHYAVLINDFGNNSGGVINIDWSSSDEGVLAVDLSNSIAASDTVICAGQSVQLVLPAWIDSIAWLEPNSTLSCTDCLDPIATPTVSTQYYAYVESLCLEDTIKIDVFVFDVDLGPDITVCLGEDVQLSTDPVYPDVVYNWTGPNLSCTTCPVAVAATPAPGIYQYTVEMVTSACTLLDTINIEVLISPAPVFEVADNITICPGTTMDLGSINNVLTNSYNWTSNPAGFISSLANPSVTPTADITYYLSVTNVGCPVLSRDSVMVSLFIPPVTDVIGDTTVCQGDLVTLGNTMDEPGAVYSWSPAGQLDDPDIANPTATMETTTEFILTTTFTTCTYMDTVTVTSVVINSVIDNPNDTLLICQGDNITLTVSVEPLTAIAEWTTDNGSFMATGNSIVISPTEETIFFATVSVPGCSETDQITVLVDSIPSPTLIMPSDTSVCRGALVVLSSQAYLPSAYPDIVHEWTPDIGFESPDSLYNMVIEAVDTITFYRTTTNGGCTVIDSATISILETTTIDVAPIDPEICVNGSIELMASSPDITEFEWESSADLSDAEGSTTTLTAPGTAGPVSVMVEGEFLGCPVMQQISVNVIANPFANLNDDASICPGESADLVSTANPNVTYSWTADPGPLGFGINETNPQASPAATTSYMAVTSNGICPDAIETIVVEIQGDAAFSNINEDVFVCLLPDNEPPVNPPTVSVTLSVEGNSTVGSMYSWTSVPESSPPTSTSTNPTFEFDAAGTTLFEVTFTNGCGDSVTETISVTVHPGVDVLNDPEIFISPDPLPDGSYGEGTLVDLTANTNPPTGNFSYNWEIGGAALDSTININLIEDPTYFDVTVTDENGCSDSGAEKVDVVKPFWELPNAFTPDGDRINDNFALLTEGKIIIQSFEIWNRWGIKVYSGTDSIGWNGTYKDKPAPMDVYIYHIVLERPSGLIEERKGDVTLIR
ncbi:MAG: gliding motility-associated-like protein [Flavobacteriales bacterium]|jgi:gliding motility-associated-like protein